MIDIDELFAQRLRFARGHRRLSQADLAVRSGLNQSAICHFEAANRMPSLPNLLKLVTALDVSADWLLGRSEAMEGKGGGQQP